MNQTTMKQTTFASLAFDRKKKQTRRKRFPGEMEAVVPWAGLLAVIEPHYPTTGRHGRPPWPETGAWKPKRPRNAAVEAEKSIIEVGRNGWLG